MIHRGLPTTSLGRKHPEAKFMRLPIARHAPSRGLSFALIAAASSRHPYEDATLVDPTTAAFAVADGATRAEYPDAIAGSTAIANVVVAGLVANANTAARDLRAAFEAANRYARSVNHIPRAGAEEYSAVAVVAHIDKARHLRFAFLGDCGLAVYTKANDARLETPNGLDAAQAHLRKRGLDDPDERRRYVATFLRNNPQATDAEGSPVGFGALTGEPSALSFVRSGELVLVAGDTVLAFSDGGRTLIGSHLAKLLDGLRGKATDVDVGPVDLPDDVSIIAATVHGD